MILRGKGRKEKEKRGGKGWGWTERGRKEWERWGGMKKEEHRGVESMCFSLMYVNSCSHGREFGSNPAVQGAWTWLLSWQQTVQDKHDNMSNDATASFPGPSPISCGLGIRLEDTQLHVKLPQVFHCLYGGSEKYLTLASFPAFCHLQYGLGTMLFWTSCWPLITARWAPAPSSTVLNTHTIYVGMVASFPGHPPKFTGSDGSLGMRLGIRGVWHHISMESFSGVTGEGVRVVKGGLDPSVEPNSFFLCCRD